MEFKTQYVKDIYQHFKAKAADQFGFKSAMEFVELILIPKLDGVVMHRPFQKPVDGTLSISGHHLILSSRKEGVEELWLLHHNVDAVERRLNGLLGGSLIIKCKDFRIIQLDISTPDEFSKVATTIENLSSLDDPTKLYPFFYRPMFPILEDGWTAFRPETEYSQLVTSQADEWRISYINKDFSAPILRDVRKTRDSSILFLDQENEVILLIHELRHWHKQQRLEALVEREWLQAGYPFPIRHRKSCYSSGRTKMQAPTFLLFLDCVCQIHQQFPCSFEFSTSFLIMLFEHSYCSEFGTFLGTCEADRTRLKLSQRTVSLWSYLNRPDVLQSFLNPMYDPNNRVIWPSVAPMSLSLWSELFLRWVVDQTPQQKAWETITSLREKDKELRLKATRLRRQLLDLEREAVEAGILLPASSDPVPSEEVAANA
ncbi:hypothetical protein C0J52_06724 [Blattella germanica]|nr:hypothetical protein C0J52_06724 [Blattella germanica]